MPIKQRPVTNDHRPTKNDGIYVLTGPVHSGKTTFLAGAAARWKASGLDVGGFLSVARPGDGCDQGYALVDLRDGASAPFLTQEGEPEWPSVGPYRFFPQALERAKDILRRDRDADVLVVDEVGPAELDEGGLWPALAEALASGARCLCVVREEILEEFRAKIGPRKSMVFRHDAPGVLESLTDALAADRAGRRSRGAGP
jgi:nucleoside-triphosphatase THEP1